MTRKYFKKTQESPPADTQSEASTVSAEEAPAETGGTPAPSSSWIRRGTYKTFYAVSYGVVFGSLLMKKLLIPKDSVIEIALHDGAVAAEQAFEEKVHLFTEVARETEEILSDQEPPAVPA